jgi:hypothetical protein
MWECWYQQEPKLMPVLVETVDYCLREDINSPPPHLQNVKTSSSASIASSGGVDSVEELLRKTVNGYRPPLNINSPFQNMPPMLTSLVTRLWSNQPENRPSSSEVRDLISSTQFKEEIQQVERRNLLPMG